MKCPKCNLDIADGSKFCTKCGTNIAEAFEEQKKLRVAEEAKKAEELKKAEEAKKAEELRIAEEQKKEDEAAESESTEKETESIEKNEEPEKVEKANTIDTKKNSKEPKEKKNKKKKKHTGLKVIFSFLIIVIIILACCYGLYKVDLLPEPLNGYLTPFFETIEGWFGIDNKDDEENIASNSEEDKKDVIKKKVEKEDLVFDYYNKEILKHEYKIPEINLDYENIEKINKEIDDLVEKEIKELEKETEFPEMALAGTEYNWYLNDNILSLVFCTKNYNVENYYVYNVDIYTGETVENEDILDFAKMEESDFTEKCVDAVSDYYDNILYSPEVKAQTGYYFTDSRNKSIAEKNFKVSKSKIYLNDNGDVCIIAEIYLVAGPTLNNFPINIENLRKNKQSTSTASNTVDSKNTANVTNSANTTNTSNEVLKNTTNSVKNSTNSNI